MVSSQPQLDSEAIDESGWKRLGVSMQGHTHVQHEIPCQDAFSIRVEGNCMAAAVADGAGCYEHSDLGALIASRNVVDSAITFAPELADENAVREALQIAFEDAAEAIEVNAPDLDVAPDELSCTLVVALATPKYIGFGIIGDSGAVCMQENGTGVNYVLPVTPQKGRYANETTFLSSRSVHQSLDIEIWPRHLIHAFALASDGLLELGVHLADHEVSSGFFPPLLRRFVESPSKVFQTDIEELLRSAFITERTGDDKTLVFLAPRPTP